MAEFPKPFAPMLLTEVKRPFHKPGWIYEEKYDGYRAVAYKHDGRVRLISRNLKDLTKQFAEVAEAVARLRAPSLVLDGEIAVFDEHLVSHLGYLRASRGREEEKLLTPPILIAFDCLYARGKELFREPLRRRRSILERELAEAEGPLLVARRLGPGGLDAWEEVKAHGWEGLVAKDSASLYEPATRTPSWIKVKHKVRVGWPGEGTESLRG
jgi:bifunctional non-homologous end joining protein LigD